MEDRKKVLLKSRAGILEHNKKVKSEGKKGFSSWSRKPKNQRVLAATSILAIIAGAFVVKDKDTIKSIINRLKEEVKTAGKYSGKWFERVSEEELNTEREKVRLEYCSSGDNFSEACRLQKLLWRFDKEISKRAWGDRKTQAPSLQRENGWYLPNED